MRRFKEKLKEHFRGVLETKKSPHSVAIGFAIGTFIAIMPTPFINVFIGLLILLIFKKVSKISMFLAFLVWNPFVKVPLYLVNFKLGDIIFGNSPPVHYNVQIINIALNYTRRYLVGCTITAATLAIMSYFIVYFLMKQYRKNKPA